MTERLVPDHSRSTLAASTPAQRIAELTSLAIRLQEELDEAIAEKEKLENRLVRHETLGGVSFGGISVAQAWVEFILWESLLNDRRFEAIFELGSWQGGFSWWLWAQAQVRKQQFHTFDSIQPQAEMPPDCFTRLDVFASSMKLGDLFREWEPCIVFCDNGNKPRELQTFAQWLRDPESLLVVHDWGTEIQPEDVPDTVEMVYREFCEGLRSMSRVFRLRRDDA
jgi:hypothetical protein